MKVTILGSGTPLPDVRRAGPGFVLQVDDRHVQIDAGGDCVRRQLEAGISPGDITELFITHLHSDHILGFPHLMMAGWDIGDASKIRDHLNVYGPPGTVKLKQGLFDIYDDDIRYRLSCGLPAKGMMDMGVTDNGPGPIVSDGGLTVSASSSTHSFYNLAYRFDYSGQSIVFSGDTAPNADVTQLARGADVLFHDSTLDPYVRDLVVRRNGSNEAWSRLQAEHSGPRDAGRAASAAGVGKLVLIHVHPDADAERAIEEAASEFSGEVIVAEDLAEITI